MAKKTNDTVTFNKGQYLFKENEPARKVFLIQAGLVSVTAQRESRQVELYQLAAPQVVGLEGIRGTETYHASAMALNDTDVVELPTALVKATIEKSPANIKLLTLSLINKNDLIISELKKIKLDENTIPCPPELTAKLFVTIFHVASYSGTPTKGLVKVFWPTFRKYCQRIFGESPVRLEGAIYLLSNLKYANLEMIKDETDPEAPEELGYVYFKDLDQIESFSKFFWKRYRTLKHQSLSMAQDDPSLRTGEALLRAFGSNGDTPESVVNVPLEDAISVLKSELDAEVFERSHLEAIIAQGFPAEIIEPQGQPGQWMLSFVATKIEKIFQNWRILNKIAEWNKNGKAPGAPKDR